MSKDKEEFSQTIPKSDSTNKMSYLKEKYGTTVESARPENDKNYKSKGKKSERETMQEKITELEERCENLEVTKKATERHLRF